MTTTVLPSSLLLAATTTDKAEDSSYGEIHTFNWPHATLPSSCIARTSNRPAFAVVTTLFARFVLAAQGKGRKNQDHKYSQPDLTVELG